MNEYQFQNRCATCERNFKNIARAAVEPRAALSRSVIPAAEAQSPPKTIITTTPIAWPGKPRPFLVSLDGTTCCPSCGQPGQIPHHLSLIFWTFWSHTRLAALLAAMRPGERLAWLAKGLVKVEGAGGQRELREVGGRWDEVPK